MPKKVYEVANELGIGALDLVEKLRGQGFPIRNHMSVLSDEEVVKVVEFLDSVARKDVKKKAVKKSKVVKETSSVSVEDEKNREKEKDKDKEKEGEKRKSAAIVRRKVVAEKVEADESPVVFSLPPEIKPVETVSEENSDSAEFEETQVFTFSAEKLASYDESEERELENQQEQYIPEDEPEEIEEKEEERPLDLTEPEQEIASSASNMSDGNIGNIGNVGNIKKKEDSEDKNGNGAEDIPVSIEEVAKNLVETTPVIEKKEETKSRVSESGGKMQGLRVVYRPPTPPVVPVEEIKVEKVEKTKKEVYEEKMHTFTPVYIPPKKEEKREVRTPTEGRRDLIKRASERALNAAPGATIAGLSAGGVATVSDGPKVLLRKDRKDPPPREGGMAGRSAGSRDFSRPGSVPPDQLDKDGVRKEKFRVRSFDAPPDLDTLDEIEKAKKKLGGGTLAAVATPRSKITKAKDMVQMRADEELKSYNLGIIGKVVYSNIGRKKIYNGPTKGTLITEMKESKRVIEVETGLTVQDLAPRLAVKFEDLRDRALELNLLLAPDDYLGLTLLKEVVALYKYRIEDVSFDENIALDRVRDTGVTDSEESEEDSEKWPIRSPVVTVMGHVDHGKTTLLDYIRKTKVASREAGGITQHIAAYKVPVNDREITFIDTPGHAAFAAMRERGASVTDIVVLVVAADDGVMPQTKESIRFCKNHDVEIIVAVNKMDKEGVNPDRIKQELMEFELTPEEWGGSTQYVPISGLTGLGVDHLLESILIQSDVMELRADPKAKVEGVVIESQIEQGRGPMITAIVHKGVLKKGDVIIVGETYGRARNLLDHNNEAIDEAGPSTPVRILGLSDIPKPGDEINVVGSEREAKKIVENRIAKRKELEAAPKPKMTLEDFLKTHNVESGETKTLKLIVRADVQGSYEAIKLALAQVGNQEVKVEVIGGGIGSIIDSDVQLAKSANGYIVGFGVGPATTARRLSEQYGIEIKSYRIIYELIQDVKLALEGLLTPVTEERYIGRAEVRDIFNVPKIGAIAGTAVVDGKIERGCRIRVLRDGKIIHDGTIGSLRRFKDDVKEVKSGYECGISIENFDKIEVRDIFEAYVMDTKKRTLEESSATL